VRDREKEHEREGDERNFRSPCGHSRERSIKGRGKTMALQSAKLLSFLTSDRWVITAHESGVPENRR
jgi:hypothetical protein